jgi:hypothetical protein
VVSAAAVRPGQNGSYVFVVEEARARLQPVKVSRQIEDLAVIAEGLEGGEAVITEIPYDLAPGKTVNVIGKLRS